MSMSVAGGNLRINLWLWISDDHFSPWESHHSTGYSCLLVSPEATNWAPGVFVKDLWNTNKFLLPLHPEWTRHILLVTNICILNRKTVWVKPEACPGFQWVLQLSMFSSFPLTSSLLVVAFLGQRLLVSPTNFTLIPAVVCGLEAAFSLDLPSACTTCTPSEDTHSNKKMVHMMQPTLCKSQIRGIKEKQKTQISWKQMSVTETRFVWTTWWIQLQDFSTSWTGWNSEHSTGEVLLCNFTS